MTIQASLRGIIVWGKTPRWLPWRGLIWWAYRPDDYHDPRFRLVPRR